MLRKLLNILLAATLFTSYFLILPTKTLAADFVMNIERIYKVDESGELLHITEERTVSNYSSDFYIPASSQETFTVQNFKEGLDNTELKIKLNSISVTESYGNSLIYDVNQENEDIVITVSYPGAIRGNQSRVFKLTYDTNELIEKVGNVTNIYIPGLSSSYKEYVTDEGSGTITQILYSTKLVVPNSIGASSFTLPQPHDTTTSNGYTTYTFNTSDIINKSVWHQIGDKQYYYFKITQPSKKSDYFTPEELDFISRNQFKIILPRDYSETNQQVFFTKISPTPQSIEIDNLGNVIATFLTNATKDEDITVEGYLSVSIDGKNTKNLSQAENSTLKDISNFSDMSQYLKEAQYWEVENEQIQKKAKELKGESTNILEILQKDYQFVVESIDYDNFKYGSQNQRQGALATLNGGSSVCMEYSDLLITLARAQGIPARAAYGYGYDPQIQPDQQEDHQWVQAWIPAYGWLTIDPTWGETGREFIGKDLDHALWYVAAESPNNPSPLEVLSSNSNVELEDSLIEIIAVDQIPQNVELKTLTELVDEVKENDTQLNQISRKIQTTILGRAFIIIVPITLTVILIITIAGTIIKKIGKHKNQANTV